MADTSHGINNVPRDHYPTYQVYNSKSGCAAPFQYCTAAPEVLSSHDNNLFHTLPDRLHRLNDQCGNDGENHNSQQLTDGQI